MQSASPAKLLIKDLPPLHQHIALHSGLDENDPADKPITFDSIVKGLTELGETHEDAESTADRVLSVACLTLKNAKGHLYNIRGVTLTIQDAIGLMHSARHTAIYDASGNVRQDVLQELFQEKYVEEEKTATGTEKLIPASKLMQFRQARFNVNKETNPSGCCAAFFAKQASDKEFGSFIRLYPVPTRTMKVNGKDESCFTPEEIDEFYNKPYVSGNKLKGRVKEQRAAPIAIFKTG